MKNEAELYNARGSCIQGISEIKGHFFVIIVKSKGPRSPSAPSFYVSGQRYHIAGGYSAHTHAVESVQEIFREPKKYHFSFIATCTKTCTETRNSLRQCKWRSGLPLAKPEISVHDDDDEFNNI